MVFVATGGLGCGDSKANESTHERDLEGVAGVGVRHVFCHERIGRAQLGISNDKAGNVIVVLLDPDPLSFVFDVEAFA